MQNQSEQNKDLYLFINLKSFTRAILGMTHTTLSYFLSVNFEKLFNENLHERNNSTFQILYHVALIIQMSSLFPTLFVFTSCGKNNFTSQKSATKDRGVV